MKWETPTAVDFRFGMEITMYVSNRWEATWPGPAQAGPAPRCLTASATR